MSAFKYILAFSMAMGAISPAFAADENDVARDNLDEMELAADVEDMEAYGEAALQEENKKEAARLEQETKTLQKELSAMERESARAKEKTARLQALYVERDRLAQKAAYKAKNAEKVRNNVQAKVSNLQDKVYNKEKQAIASLERRKAADQEIARQLKIEKNLKNRLRIAERAIKQNEYRRTRSKMRANQMRKNNWRAEQNVLRKERQAVRTASR